jgi:hypothetical protein
MGVEGCAVARGESGHTRGVGVKLLFVKNGQVSGLDVAELYVVAHFSMPARGVGPAHSLG